MSETITANDQQLRRAQFSRNNLRRSIPAILANWALPAVTYAVLSTQLSSDFTALLISSAIPVLITLAVFLFRRKINAIGMVAVVGFAISLAVSVLTGGSALALKLQDPALTGLLGLVLLVSVAIGHPLLTVIGRLRARRGSTAATPLNGRRMAVTTALLGVTLIVHGAAVTVLALTVPTATFLALSRPVGLPVLALGLLLTYWYARRSGRNAVSPVSETEISR